MLMYMQDENPLKPPLRAQQYAGRWQMQQGDKELTPL